MGIERKEIALWSFIVMGIGAWEWVVILVVVVLLFGTKKLPELGSGLGKAISNFKKSYREGTEIDVTPEKDKIPSEEKKS